MVGPVGKATDSYSAHVIRRCPFFNSTMFLPTDGTACLSYPVIWTSGFQSQGPSRSELSHRNIYQNVP